MTAFGCGAKTDLDEPPVRGRPSRPTDVVGLAASFDHGCALRAEGDVLCWGENRYLPLGAVPIGDYPTPVPLMWPGYAADLLQIDSTAEHGCGVRREGGAFCWGANWVEVLDDGTRRPTVHGGPVVGVTDAIAVTTGWRHSCALRASGEVACWGPAGSQGELGDGAHVRSPTPVNVAGIDDAFRINAGNEHTCAILAGGGLVGWGRNFEGQIGDGTTEARFVPVPVLPEATDVVDVAAAINETCAVSGTGTVLCWGSRGVSRAPQLVPQLVPGIDDAVAIDGHAFFCAIRTNGRVACWGSPSVGGIVSHGAPEDVPGLTGVVKVTVANVHACVLRSSGEVLCWGHNDHGQLGDGTTEPRDGPVRVIGLEANDAAFTETLATAGPASSP